MGFVQAKAAANHHEADEQCWSESGFNSSNEISLVLLLEIFLFFSKCPTFNRWNSSYLPSYWRHLWVYDHMHV